MTQNEKTANTVPVPAPLDPRGYDVQPFGPPGNPEIAEQFARNLERKHAAEMAGQTLVNRHVERPNTTPY